VSATTQARRADRAATGHAESLTSGRETDRLRRLGICIPASLVERASAIAVSRRTTRNAVLKVALEQGIGVLDPRAPESRIDANTARKRPPEAFEQMRFRIGADQKRRIEAFALRKGCRDLSSAIAELVTTALDDEDLGENLPATKADDIDERLVQLRDLLGEIGPGVLGILSLVAHWATQGGGLEVDEDELVDEAWAAGEQAWAMRQETAADDTRENPILDQQGGR
jgi:hypothetical protein